MTRRPSTTRKNSSWASCLCQWKSPSITPRRTTASLTVVSVWLNHGSCAAASAATSISRRAPNLSSRWMSYSRAMGGWYQTPIVDWPLVARERELKSVRSAGGGGVVITGEAGVGKTRLAREIAEAAVAPVEWGRATRSAASMPLGAFAALLPAERGEGVELLARARHALAERAGGRRPVLCVDDGQHLDDASAALVHQLVAAGEAFAVVTVRRGERVPDALQALWKDELCELIELDPLPREALDGLLRAALGGPVDGGGRGALWELTQGNALFVRELVHYGTARDMPAEDGGVWRWHGELGVGARLAELVGA